MLPFAIQALWNTPLFPKSVSNASRNARLSSSSLTAGRTCAQISVSNTSLQKGTSICCFFRTSMQPPTTVFKRLMYSFPRFSEVESAIVMVHLNVRHSYRSCGYWTRILSKGQTVLEFLFVSCSLSDSFAWFSMLIWLSGWVGFGRTIETETDEGKCMRYLLCMCIVLEVWLIWWLGGWLAGWWVPCFEEREIVLALSLALCTIWRCKRKRTKYCF